MNPDLKLNLTVLDAQWLEMMVLHFENHFPAFRQALRLQISHHFYNGVHEMTLDHKGPRYPTELNEIFEIMNGPKMILVISHDSCDLNYMHTISTGVRIH